MFRPVPVFPDGHDDNDVGGDGNQINSGDSGNVAKDIDVNTNDTNDSGLDDNEDEDDNNDNNLVPDNHDDEESEEEELQMDNVTCYLADIALRKLATSPNISKLKNISLEEFHHKKKI